LHPLAAGLSLMDLFRHPTVRTLAGRIDELAPAPSAREIARA
jgi:hypothetical protein